MKIYSILPYFAIYLKKTFSIILWHCMIPVSSSCIEDEGKDRRSYIYRYLVVQQHWGFVAVNGTYMNETQEVALECAERWQTAYKGVYVLYHALFSYTRSERMISEYRQCRATTLFQLHQDEACVCVVSVLHASPYLLEICCGESGRVGTIFAAIPFAQIKQCIQDCMNITVIDVVKRNTLTHYIR
jgi:hypothetical protein